MDKQAYVLKMLELLEKTRPLAGDLKSLILSNPVNDIMIDMLIHTFQDTVKDIKDYKTKKQLQQSTEFLKKLKEMEQHEKVENTADIQKLEELLYDHTT